MKRHVLSLAAVIVAGLGVSMAGAVARVPDQMRISGIKGEVQICDRSNNCNPAQEGQALNQGDIIKVGADSKARLDHGAKDRFELRERSRVMVDQLTPRGSRLELFVGTLKARIKSGFFQRRDVSVVTAVGVMAVRGTEFLCKADENGNVQTDVMYGRVDVLDSDGGYKDSLIQGESGNAKGDAPKDDYKAEGKSGEDKAGEGDKEGQGEGAPPQMGDSKGGKGDGPQGKMEKGEMSNESFAEGFGGVEGFQAYGRANEESNDKAQDFAGNESAKVSDIVSSVREDDLTSGRALIDRHGNLVRVEQRLQRPTGDTLQFVNFVKRDEYAFKGYFAPDNLTSAARKDYMKATVTFNKSLPESIADWPAFFSENSDVLKVTGMNAELANGIDVNNQDYIKFNTAYNSAKNEVGGAQCLGKQTLGTDCFEETIVGFVKNTTKKGEWRVSDCNSSNCGSTTAEIKSHGGDVDDGGDGSGNLWGKAEAPINVENEIIDTENLVVEANAATAEMWLLTESYAIDNSGSILNINNILNSNITDPFTFMKSVGIETVMTLRTDKSANAGQTIFQNRGNIDLVIIPDLMVDIVQKYAGQLAGSL